MNTLLRQHHGWLGFLASLALAGCALPRFEADEKDIPFSVHLMIESDNEGSQLSGANLEARLSKRDAEALGTEPTEPVVVGFNAVFKSEDFVGSEDISAQGPCLQDDLLIVNTESDESWIAIPADICLRGNSTYTVPLTNSR